MLANQTWLIFKLQLGGHTLDTPDLRKVSRALELKQIFSFTQQTHLLKEQPDVAGFPLRIWSTKALNSLLCSNPTAIQTAHKQPLNRTASHIPPACSSWPWSRDYTCKRRRLSLWFTIKPIPLHSSIWWLTEWLK